MKVSRLTLVSLALLMFVSIHQEVRSQIVEVGATAGVSYYIGDINPAKHFGQSDFGFGASVRYYQSPRWAFRFQYSNLNLGSADMVSGFRPERGLAFTDRINDFSVMAEFNFFNYWTGSKRSFISPYIFAGVSVFTFDPCHEDGTRLRPIRTEGVDYSLVSWSIPFGIGVKYSLGKRVGLTLEWRLHKTFTDYIDDVSGLYPDPELVNGSYVYSDPGYVSDNVDYVVPDGKQRGNGTVGPLGYNCDFFGTLGLTISYKFNLPKSKRCDAGASGRYY